jgi:hypothetical protein
MEFRRRNHIPQSTSFLFAFHSIERGRTAKKKKRIERNWTEAIFFLASVPDCHIGPAKMGSDR